jgi:hypothetical protein
VLWLWFGTHLETLMIKKTIFYSAMLSTLALISCGGGGGGGGASSTVNLGGKVIDGYIQGATVCLDLNSNNVCDPGEPSTTSAADGSYTLSYSGSIAGLQVISQVPAGAVDSDLGKITQPYTLAAPVPTNSSDYANTHVTPLTTLVANAIQQQGGQSQLTPAAAQAQIINTLGLPASTSLTADYKATGNTSLAQIATYTAAAIAQVSNNLSSNTTVASQLSPGQIVQAAVQQVQNTVLPAVLSNGSLTSSAATAVTSAVAAKDPTALTGTNGAVTTAISNAGLSSTSVASATTGGTITGSVLNIVNGTKASTSSSVVNLQSLFANTGIVIVNKDNSSFIDQSGNVSCIDGNGKSNLYNTTYGGGGGNCSTNILKAEFIKFDTNNNSGNLDVTFDLVGSNPNWFTDYERDGNLTYDGKSWVVENNGPANKSTPPTFTNNCINVPQSAGITQQYCAVQVDVSSQIITNYIPDLCSNSPPSGCSTATFPSGSIGYSLTLSVQSSINDSDTYNGYFQLWVSKSWTGYCTGNNPNANRCSNPNDTVTDLINNFLNNTNAYQWMGNCNVPFQIASYDATKKTGVINFGTGQNCNSSTYTFSSVETQNFNVVTKAGVDVIVFPTPAVLKQNNPGNNDPYQIFARGCLPNSTTNCGIYNGSYEPINFSQSIPFNGNLNSNAQIVNPTLFDAVMKASGQPAYPYSGSGSSGTPTAQGTPYSPLN